MHLPTGGRFVKPRCQIESKPAWCPAAQPGQGYVDSQPPEHCGTRWMDALNSKPNARQRGSRQCLIAALMLAVLATAPLGCSLSPGERERYFAASRAVVDAAPGDGAIEYASWPSGAANQIAPLASAARRTDSARLLE